MPRPSLKKRADGRYRCKYHGHYFYGATVSEAYAARDEYIRQIEEGTASRSTVDAYAASWLPTYKAGVSKSTYKSYQRHIENLRRAVGQRQMAEVVPSDIMAIYTEYYKGQSESSISKAKMLFVALWDAAIEDGIAVRNPARSRQAKPHRGPSGSHRALSPEEDELILKVDDRLRTAVLVMRYAGLRRGEVLALDIDRDVDFEKKLIHVREAVRYDSNQPIVSDPKTSAGVRTIPLFSILEKELKGKTGLVCPNVSGKMMSLSAFQAAWVSYINQAERTLNNRPNRQIRDHHGQEPEGWQHVTIRPHDLRHSYCTMLRDAGVDLKLAIQWMGHADEKMILRIYDHITEKRIENAVENVERNLKGVNSEVKMEEKPPKPL